MIHIVMFTNIEYKLYTKDKKFGGIISTEDQFVVWKTVDQFVKLNGSRLIWGMKLVLACLKQIKQKMVWEWEPMFTIVYFGGIHWCVFVINHQHMVSITVPVT